jgi:hypothetical protein
MELRSEEGLKSEPLEDKSQNQFFIFLAGWSILNIIQSSFTGISNDEAYYWMYSRFLEWGYFDHPPAIAVIIKAGYFLSPSEFGVRLFTILLSTGTLCLIYKLSKPHKEDFLLFFIIFLSIPLVHAGGFLATPDIPFVFVVTCFLFHYKNYLENDNLKNSMILAVLFAALMYTKYHGILVIGFTIAGSWSVLKRKSFWIATFISLILFAPHLWWQYIHDFPSIRYHLFDRSTEKYKIDFTLEFIGGQVLILGPFTGLILLYTSFKNQEKIPFNRILKFNLAGILIFFLISSFKSRIEANWTSAAFIPLIILSFNYIKSRVRLRKWTIGLSIPTMILIVIARVFLMLPEIPFPVRANNEFFKWKAWAKQVENKAGQAPVVFMNSYQKASKYTFYTGRTAHSLNNFMYRKNQYDIWPIEDSLQGKKVFLITNYETNLDTFKNVFGETYHYKVIENFRSFNKVKIEALLDEKLTSKPGDTLQFEINLKNEATYPSDFFLNKDYPSQLSINYYLDGEYNSTVFYPLKVARIEVGETVRQSIKFLAPGVKGKYKFRIAIQTGWLPMGLNSNLIPLEVTD